MGKHLPTAAASQPVSFNIPIAKRTIGSNGISTANSLSPSKSRFNGLKASKLIIAPITEWLGNLSSSKSKAAPTGDSAKESLSKKKEKKKSKQVDDEQVDDELPDIPLPPSPFHLPPSTSMTKNEQTIDGGTRVQNKMDQIWRTAIKRAGKKTKLHTEEEYIQWPEALLGSKISEFQKEVVIRYEEEEAGSSVSTKFSNEKQNPNNLVKRKDVSGLFSLEDYTLDSTPYASNIRFSKPSSNMTLCQKISYPGKNQEDFGNFGSALNTTVGSCYGSGYSPMSPSVSTIKVAEKIRAVDGRLITCFFTKAYCFSNHFFKMKLMEIDGTNYICVEQYYMYYKAKVFGDRQAANRIMLSAAPGTMKKVGSSIANFDQNKWRPVAMQVMVIGALRKFEQNEDLRYHLFNTDGSMLVEASPSDKFWGVGLGMNSPAIRNIVNWPGKNVLGKILTIVREKLMRRPEFSAEILS